MFIQSVGPMGQECKNEGFGIYPKSGQPEPDSSDWLISTSRSLKTQVFVSSEPLPSSHCSCNRKQQDRLDFLLCCRTFRTLNHRTVPQMFMTQGIVGSFVFRSESRIRCLAAKRSSHISDRKRHKTFSFCFLSALTATTIKNSWFFKRSKQWYRLHPPLPPHKHGKH